MAEILDPKDRELIALLRANGREPTSSLARKLGISRSTVQSRIARLEQKRVIGGFTVRLTEDFESQRVKAHVMLTVAPKLTPRIAKDLEKMPEVTSLYSISGSYDMIAIVTTQNTAEMDQVIDEIGKIQGIERTTTSIILSTKFER
ncbi:MAG: Lrp/AsnC family transcriptional regulator [Alphaproteobacteria bacterium]|nr:MAG: Lrp/AsnC family transcriptional regulator [Alphaproteobacteria bacterium]